MNANLSIASPRPIDILLVDDDAGDALIAKKALESGKILNSIYSVRDGIEALAHLRNAQMPRPGLVLLDLNMPRMNGIEVMQEINKDDRLRHLVIVVLTSSKTDEDVLSSYQLRCNSYLVKPMGLDEFGTLVRALDQFWLRQAALPPGTRP